MYSYIRGTFQKHSSTAVIIETRCGIAYQLCVPLSALLALPKEGEELIVHTSLVVRENAQQLFGFLDFKERDLFELLITINGIGPKVALAIIGHLSPQQFEEQIATGETSRLKKIPGIGEKTAERLLLEMKGKLKKLSPKQFTAQKKGESISDASRTAEDAISALMNLGYSETDAQCAVYAGKESLPNEGNISLPQLIGAALRSMTQQKR